MSKPKDGGPAFPTNDEALMGMSLRAYIATQAMAAMIAAYPWRPSAAPLDEVIEPYGVRFAKTATYLADALIEELNKD